MSDINKLQRPPQIISDVACLAIGFEWYKYGVDSALGYTHSSYLPPCVNTNVPSAGDSYVLTLVPLSRSIQLASVP